MSCGQLSDVHLPEADEHENVQGLSWYALRQRKDEDGTIADTFLVENGAKLVPKQVCGF